ncbi:MAG: competence protein ComK [Bacilli bacterium]|nr:competence protein ComK [Bacilli bacterium]MBN2877611.1 competence protein ComK [Bacilli bacterium]
MIDYIIKQNDNTLDIYRDHLVQNEDTTFQKFLNLRFQNQLTSLQSREQTTKRIFGYPSKVPLYVDNTTLLMCVRSYRMQGTFYINYHAISSYEVKTNQIRITFHTKHTLLISQKHTFLRQIGRCQEILQFLKG